jgi:hypothetical protein
MIEMIEIDFRFSPTRVRDVCICILPTKIEMVFSGTPILN